MGTHPSTIHAYNTHARDWANRVQKTILAHEYLEKPAMYALLPDLYDKRVLCIGCGTGEECAYIRSLGAKEVVGVDISEGMIEIAREKFPDMQFEVMDIEHLIYADDSFDVAYSSMTMHYMESWEKALSEVHRILTKKGIFLFSTNHPVTHNAEIKRDDDGTSYMLGYAKDERDRSVDTSGDYFDTAIHQTTWPNNFTILFYNRPVSRMIQEIVSAQFAIISADEPRPIESVKQIDANFYKVYSKLPLVIIFLLQKSISED